MRLCLTRVKPQQSNQRATRHWQHEATVLSASIGAPNPLGVLASLVMRVASYGGAGMP
jgi:hypothetical protein